MRGKSVTVTVEWQRDIDLNATESQHISQHFSLDEEVTPERLAAALKAFRDALQAAPVPA